MSNENAAVCGCGITVDVSRRKVPVPLPIWRHGKSDGRSSKKSHNDGRGSKNRNSETGGSSSATEHSKPMTKSNKQERRLNPTRRTRSADRDEPSYTYIDSNSSILNGAIREIPDALYVTIPETPNAMANDTGNSLTNAQNRSSRVYTIPSMTSPPPTYDASVAKSWQSGGLLPTYEECLYHKYEMISRSHTPPPPWSDSTTNLSSTTASSSVIRTRRELAEYIAQLTISQQNNERLALHQAQQQQQHQQQQQQHQQQKQQQHSGSAHRDGSCSTNQQFCREQQIRVQQRTRQMPPRSQSESRAHQRRLQTMYEDGAFCMETTALTSMFEHGVAFCSLM